jgi:hypothetical protein
LELVKPDTTTARRVFPFDGDEDTWVEIRKLSDAETNRIYDRNKFLPNSKTATMTKASQVLKEVVDSSVVGWNNFTIKSQPLPCTAEFKMLLLDTLVPGPEGDKVSLWSVINDKFAALEEADRKN